jgi:hypothetical protein
MAYLSMLASEASLFMPEAYNSKVLLQEMIIKCNYKINSYFIYTCCEYPEIYHLDYSGCLFLHHLLGSS